MQEAQRRALIEQIVQDREQIFRTMRASWTKELITGDLTLPQLRVLFLLEHAGGLSMSSLADALGKAQPTVTGLIDRLVEGALVERLEHAADRRVIIAQITSAGRDLIAGLAEVSSGHTRVLVDGLSADELAIVAAAFALLRREAQHGPAHNTEGVTR